MTKKKTGKAVATTQNGNGDLVTFDENTAWGAGKKVDVSEIEIPKLLLLQGNATVVVEKPHLNLKAGDIIDSMDEKVVDSREKSKIEFVVIDSFKTRMVFENDEYIKSEPWVPSFSDREKWPFDGKMINGVLTKWREVRHYYVLRTDQIAEGISFPYVISFKGLGIKTAGKLATELAKLDQFNAPSAARVFRLFAEQEKTDNGVFWVMKVDSVRNSTPEEVEIGYKWFQTIQSKNVVIDEVSEDPTEEAASGTSAVSGGASEAGAGFQV